MSLGGLSVAHLTQSLFFRYTFRGTPRFSVQVRTQARVAPLASRSWQEEITRTSKKEDEELNKGLKNHEIYLNPEYQKHNIMA
ncbi:hypothetical protein NDU88_003470 [Pleurodeles waltl]|uniref:Uncharacterized protein n=1 Tax=Pleurodeles waltl TaxID=8319 RepID=A0AAV7KV19_PLEWA|nr:hypothetical protein NDU88_003470 [Pleurodeles waltl]